MLAESLQVFRLKMESWNICHYVLYDSIKLNYVQQNCFISMKFSSSVLSNQQDCLTSGRPSNA